MIRDHQYIAVGGNIASSQHSGPEPAGEDRALRAAGRGPREPADRIWQDGRERFREASIRRKSGAAVRSLGRSQSLKVSYGPQVGHFLRADLAAGVLGEMFAKLSHRQRVQ